VPERRQDRCLRDVTKPNDCISDRGRHAVLNSTRRTTRA
jgi:hypothetical protein